MKLTEISIHPATELLRDCTFPHKFEVDEWGARTFVGLDLENPKPFDLGTANPNDELGYQRYLSQYRNTESADTSNIVNADVLEVAQRAMDIKAAADAIK